jgi:hypothetical protein
MRVHFDLMYCWSVNAHSLRHSVFGVHYSIFAFYVCSGVHVYHVLAC